MKEEKFETFNGWDENLFIEDDVYDTAGISTLLEDDEISPWEEGFMAGYREAS